MGESSWETSFVRSKRDEEDEYDEEIASCPRSSQHHLESRAPLSPAPPPPDTHIDDDDDDEEPHVAPQQMPSVSSTESSEVSSRSVPEVTHSTDDKPAVSSTSLISLDTNFVLNNNNLSSSSSNSSKREKLLRDDEQHNLRSKLPLKGSLSLDPSTLTRQHTTPVLPPPLQYANISPNSITSINSSAEDVILVETPPERRRPYSVQTTPQSRRLLNDSEISC